MFLIKLIIVKFFVSRFKCIHDYIYFSNHAQEMSLMQSSPDRPIHRVPTNHYLVRVFTCSLGGVDWSCFETHKSLEV